MHAIVYAHRLLCLFPPTPDGHMLESMLEVTRELVKVVGGNAYHRLPRSVFRVGIFRIKWIKKYWGELAWIAYRFGRDVGHRKTSPYTPTTLYHRILRDLHMWTQDISDLGRDDLSDTVPIALEYLSQLSIPEIERNHRKFLRVMAKLPPNVHARKIRPEQFVRRGDVEIFEPRGLMAKLLRY